MLKNANVWLCSAIGLAGGVILTGSAPKAEAASVVNGCHWHYHDNYWSYWHAGDKRWCHTDGKAWSLYPFDGSSSARDSCMAGTRGLRSENIVVPSHEFIPAVGPVAGGHLSIRDHSAGRVVLSRPSGRADIIAAP